MTLARDLVVLALATCASYTDVRYRRIPNLLTGPALVAALGLAFATSGWPGVLSATFGLVSCGGVLALTAMAGGMGGGDVKLMAAMGALLRVPLALHGLLYSAMLGGILAVVMAATRADLGRALGNIRAWLWGVLRLSKNRPRLGEGSPLYVPYGVAIAAGATWAVASQYVPALALP